MIDNYYENDDSENEEKWVLGLPFWKKYQFSFDIDNKLLYFYNKDGKFLDKTMQTIIEDNENINNDTNITNNQRITNDSTNKNQSSNISTMAISDINTKNKFNKNNTIKLDKTILYYAEPRTKVKEFHKIQPKIIESFIADSPDDIDTFFENEYNQDNNGNNIEEKNIIYNNVSSTKYNKTIKMKNKNSSIPTLNAISVHFKSGFLAAAKTTNIT